MSKLSRKVPELSLLHYVNGSRKQQDDFVEKLFLGLKEYGFIILTDHTLSESVISKGYKAAKDFFDLDEEVKRQYICKAGGGQRGYTPFGTEHAKDNPYKDLKEFWHVGREVEADHEFSEFYPPNIWPENIEDFQQDLSLLYTELDKTAHILLQALGKALKVSNHFFSDMIENGNSILRAIHYPPVGEAPPVGSVRAAAHADINLITILMGATASGLQLLDKNEVWLDVDTKPGQLVVDAGDMLARITNDVIPATIHRVINPEQSTDARFSMPFFVHPHPKAILECIPSCIGEGVKYPPISSHACLQERLREIGLM